MRTVRVHQNLLIKYPCADVWYLAHAFDPMGRGVVELGYAELSLLKQSKSTIYRKLKDGVKLGFFRGYEAKNGVFTIYLGGLIPVCLANEIKDWGAVATFDISQVLEDRKQLGVFLATLNAQNSSRYAAKNSMKARERKDLRVLTADEIFALASDSSPTLLVNRGVTSEAGIISVGGGQIKVNEKFIPFGASQEAIAAELNIHPTTLRSYLKYVNRYQIVQCKPEYQELYLSLIHEAGSYHCGDVSYFERDDNTITLYEKNGRSSASKPGGLRVEKDRFFMDYSGRVFLRRCNLYQINLELESMRYARSKYKRLLKRVENDPIGFLP
jgi:hypothetical protein